MRLKLAVVVTMVGVGLVAVGLLSSHKEATALDGDTVRSQALEALEGEPAFKVVSRPATEESAEARGVVTEWWSAEEGLYRLDQDGPSGRRSMALSGSELIMDSGDTGLTTVREMAPGSQKGLKIGPFARYHQMVDEGMPVAAGLRSSGKNGKIVYLDMSERRNGEDRGPAMTAVLARGTKLPSRVRFMDDEEEESAFDLEVVPLKGQELAAAVQEVNAARKSVTNTDVEHMFTEEEARSFQDYGIYWLGRAAAGYPLRDIRHWEFNAESEPRQDVVSFSYDRPSERLEYDPLRVDSRPLGAGVGEMEYSRVEEEGEQIECPAGEAYALFGPEKAAQAVVRTDDAYVQVTAEGPVEEQPFRKLIKRLRRFNESVTE